MNILSLKMDLQSPCQVKREYIWRKLKKGHNSAKNWKIKNLKKTPEGIHKMNLCAKFHNSSIICVVRNQNGQNLNFMKIAQKIENLKIWKKRLGVFIRWTFVPNFIILALFVWSEWTVRNQNGQILNFIKIGQKFILAKKYLKTNYNFKFVNSVQEMNILSLKMDLQFPFQFNREYIRKK